MFEISITDGCLTLNARPEVIGAGVRKPAQSRTGRGSYLHIRRAVSHTLSSLRLSSSMESSFPTIEEAKPHWGLSAKRSSGTKRFASVMRRMRSSGASVCGRLGLFNPRTTVLSSGTCRSGANEPDRSSSYSRRSRVAPMRLKIGRAIGLIVALDEPTTFLVSTTEVNGEGHVGKSPNDSVVELDPAAQPLIERPASRFIKGPRLRGEEQGIVRRVDLNIGGSEANQPRPHHGGSRRRRRGSARGLHTRIGNVPATRNSRTGWGWARLLLRRDLCGRADRRTPRRQDAVCAQLTTPRLTGRSRRRSPTAPSPCQWPHKNALMSQGPKPSTASVIWLWNESRRISPSVTMSSPAASWRETASSTARSSMDLNCA